MSMFHTIQWMSHKVKTAFGESTKTYGGESPRHKWKLPPQGVLQGNGSGPAIWSILSSNLFHILRDDGYRNAFTSSIRQIMIELAGFAYMDDTDLVQTDEQVDRVTQKMQNLVTKWNELVSVTGGTLAPHKSWWYLVTFKYQKGKWVATEPPEDFQIQIKNTSNQSVDIQRIPVHTGINMLGVHLAPDGNITDHLNMLRDKATTWAASMQECRANSNEIWTALHRTIPFAMGYSLPAISLSKEDCQYVMAPVYRCGLPRAGISPTAIRHGPQKMGGLGLMDPYIRMGVGQIESFVTNRWLKTPTGALLEIALDDITLEMGLRSPFSSLACLKRGLGYSMTSSWIKHMLTFLVDNCISINLEGLGFQPQRVADKTIMEMALAYTHHIPTLQSINRVRMFLKVVWISDISTADGRYMDNRCVREGFQFPPRNKYTWPFKHHTTVVDWQRWRRWARDLCIDNNWKLREDLGPWMTRTEDWFEHWDCMVTNDRERLYIRTPDGGAWHRHIKQPNHRQRTTRYYREFIVYPSISESVQDMERATIKINRAQIDLISTGGSIRWSTNDTPVFYEGTLRGTRRDILQKIKETLQLEFIDATDDIQKLLLDFSSSAIVSVSDGSYYPDSGRAAGAWVIESSCGHQWIMVAMTVLEPIDQFTSY